MLSWNLKLIKDCQPLRLLITYTVLGVYLFTQALPLWCICNFILTFDNSTSVRLDCVDIKLQMFSGLTWYFWIFKECSWVNTSQDQLKAFLWHYVDLPQKIILTRP